MTCKCVFCHMNSLFFYKCDKADIKVPISVKISIFTQGPKWPLFLVRYTYIAALGELTVFLYTEWLDSSSPCSSRRQSGCGETADWGRGSAQHTDWGIALVQLHVSHDTMQLHMYMCSFTHTRVEVTLAGRVEHVYMRVYNNYTCKCCI